MGQFLGSKRYYLVRLTSTGAVGELISCSNSMLVLQESALKRIEEDPVYNRHGFGIVELIRTVAPKISFTADITQLEWKGEEEEGREVWDEREVASDDDPHE